jgi:hypothetical protein
MITNMYLVLACRPDSLARMDAAVEARSEGDAYEIWRRQFGYYDADPMSFPDYSDVVVTLLPNLTGEPRAYPLDLMD